jgi:hypothetical protein
MAIQRRADGSGVEVSEALPLSLPGGGGKTMPEGTRAVMEHAFGADFSAVRIHEGSQARAMRALAFTRGTDVHFAPGRYNPHTRPGRQLLGHELAHACSVVTSPPG